MTTRTRIANTVASASVCIGGLVGVLAPGLAEAQTRSAVDVSAGVRAATNPYDAVGAGKAAVAVTLSVDPSVFIERELSTLSLTGSARVDQYLSRYGTDLSARVNADYDRRLSEAASVGATASFSTTRSGISDLLRNGVGQDGSGTPPVIVDQQIIDVAGVPSRQNRYSFGVRAKVRPSQFDSLQASTGVAFSRIASGLGQDFRQLYTNVGYSRTLSESTSLTAQVGFSDIDYSGRRDGDGQILSPLVGINLRIDPTLTLSVAGGVSIAWIEHNGRKRSQAGLAAQATLCKRGELTSFCLNGSRDTQPSSLGGVSRATSIGATYNWRLSPSDTLALSGRYGRTDQPAGSQNAFGLRNTEYYSANATYSKRLSERLYLTVSPGFDKVRDRIISRKANYEIMAGLRVRLGDYR